MKVSSKKIDDKIYFQNFVVVKESPNFYGVYERYSPNYSYYLSYNLITSGTTLQNACKKAKLLQIGYNLAKEENESNI